MRPVSLALDQLQSEEEAFIGILLPTLAMAIKKLRDVLANYEVALCVPLVAVLIRLKNDFMKFRTAQNMNLRQLFTLLSPILA